MKQSLVSTMFAGLLVSFAFVTAALGADANRLVMNNQNVYAESTGQTLPLLANLAQDTYAISIHLQFDATKISMSAPTLGSASLAVSPEYSHGTITPSPGSMVWGIVFDTSDPIEKKLAATTGTAVEVLILNFNVIATTASTTKLDLVDIEGNPSRLNVFTNAVGGSLAPAPSDLIDATLTIETRPLPKPPVIQSFPNGHTGCPGVNFFVTGQNFDEPGVTVEICGTAAAWTLMGAGTLRVTTPDCALVNDWAVLEICNADGCDSEVQGFFYEDCGPVEPEFLRGDANDDGFVDLGDAVAILNDLFLGQPAETTCFQVLDSNDDALVDLTDAVNILNFLFVGTGEIPEPYPVLGVDPTPDVLGCEKPVA